MAIFTDGVHLISDTSVEELHDFAQYCNIPSVWFHNPKKPATFKLTKRKPHYDLTKATKSAALMAGAILISPRELVKKLTEVLHPKFKAGDPVIIQKYGALIWFTNGPDAIPDKWPLIFKDGDIEYRDIRPELVGQYGRVSKVSIIQGKVKYALDGVAKSAWYNEDQLKLR